MKRGKRSEEEGRGGANRDDDAQAAGADEGGREGEGGSLARGEDMREE